MDSIAFSPDGRYYVVVAKDKTAGAFKADTGESLWHQQLTEVGSIDSVTFSPDGHYVTIESYESHDFGSSKEEVFVAATGEKATGFDHPVAISSDGRYVNESDKQIKGTDGGVVPEATFSVVNTATG